MQVHRRVTCPTCRARTGVSDLAYVDGGGRNAPAATTQGTEADGEAAVEVKGSYSTKVRNTASHQSRRCSADV